MAWRFISAAALTGCGVGIELTRGYEPYVRDLTLQTLPNVSHWVQQEAPEKVNLILADWLSKRGLMLGVDG